MMEESAPVVMATLLVGNHACSHVMYIYMYMYC